MAEDAQSPPLEQLPPLKSTLSTRLLLLTIAFVMYSEVLIYLPSIARYRVEWLQSRVDTAYLATLAVKATPELVTPDLADQLLTVADAIGVTVKRPHAKELMLKRGELAVDPVLVDLRSLPLLDQTMDAMATLRPRNRILRVIGERLEAESEPVEVEVLISEAPLRAALLDYSVRILSLSIAIGVFTATLVYASLQALFVRPMRRIGANMVAFRGAPEDAARAIAPTDRPDEIGMVQRELGALQTEVRAALKQKDRLAALGIAVAKVNHDLKNILATADLVSARLERSSDPEVRRIAPTLLGSIGRAIALCTRTLAYGRAEEPPPQRQRFRLAGLVDDVQAAIALPPDGRTTWRNEVPAELEIDADREQMFRVLLNLCRNAVQALEAGGEVAIRAERSEERVRIDVSDNGPGLPDAVRANLFQPFTGAGRGGGTGLGLAIARDLVRAHGGDIALAVTGPGGTVFRMHLPHRKSLEERAA
jgi:signal transduction histidine kinase